MPILMGITCNYSCFSPVISLFLRKFNGFYSGRLFNIDVPCLQMAWIFIPFSLTALRKAFALLTNKALF